MSDLNWMGLTEEQVNAGLVQRGVVTMNWVTGEDNDTAPEGTAEKTARLSDMLRPAFLAWWQTGEIVDVSEPSGMSLKKLMNGTYPIQTQPIGAFMDLDFVLKSPSSWDFTAKARA